jgi:hypothetical protein
MKPSVTVSPPPPPLLLDFPPQADAPSANAALTATTPVIFVILLRKAELPSVTFCTGYANAPQDAHPALQALFDDSWG